MKKKLVAILLTAIMIVACLPTLAIAEEPAAEEKLMFELVTELEANGEYLIVAGTKAMQNNDDVLGTMDVVVDAKGRIVITKGDAEKTVFTVDKFTKKTMHSTGKLVNNGKYLTGPKAKLAMTDVESSGELFNTWDYDNPVRYFLCGLDGIVRYDDETAGWNANGKGTEAAIYKKVKTATVTFDAGEHGTVTPKSEFLKVGDTATPPTVEAKEGYVFLGWYNEGIKWDFEDPVSNNMALEAKWERAVKFELANELEEDGEYIIVNKNYATEDARIMELNGNDLSYFEGSVSTGNVVILGEEQMKQSVFKAVGCRDDGGLKKAKLQMDNYYIGKDAPGKLDRLWLVDESNAGEFNTYNYGGEVGWKLCGYGYWIRNTGNTSKTAKDGGWWATDRFVGNYNGAYIYKKATYVATVTVGAYEKFCTEADPKIEETVEGVDFPCDIKYTITRAPGEVCRTYDIIVTGEETQANYSVEYYNGTLTIKHVLEKVDRVEPTTKKPGHLEAYRCVGCGTYFTDAAGENIIGDQEAYEKWISEGGAGYLEKLKEKEDPKTGDNSPVAETAAMAIIALLMAAYAYIEIRKQSF